jgi:hypothetical protein
MADEQARNYAKVSCLCGAQIRVDATSADRHVTCPSCDSTFDFVVSVDAARKRSRVSIVLSRAAMKTEGESLGKSSGKKAETLGKPSPLLYDTRRQVTGTFGKLGFPCFAPGE